MESRPPKHKLSKHLLEMKFMKRSALRLEKEAHEIDQQQHIDDEHWMLDLPGLQEHQNKYLMEPSFVTCENLKFGRMAFKNFNSEIEKLMKVKNSEEELAQAEERERELAVSEVEMAHRYSSLVGTIGKKFSRKRKREEESDGEEEETIVKVTRGQETSTFSSSVFDSDGKDSASSLGRTSEIVGSTLAQIRKQVDLTAGGVTPVRTNDKVDSTVTEMVALESVSKKNDTQRKNKKSPAVLDYYKKKAKSKGFMKPSD